MLRILIGVVTTLAFAVPAAAAAVPVGLSDQHADFFIRNAVAILAEMRLALAVKRPESFVKGTFVG